MPSEDPKRQEWEAVRSLKRLVKAGLELGIPEAVRKANQFAELLQDKLGSEPAEAPPNLQALVAQFVQTVKENPDSLVQLAKEVWSRGGKEAKEDAADAVGTGLGLFSPHRALQVAKELATMARNGREADLLGNRAIGPILERQPMMMDRVKLFLKENERLLRYAAIAGLVAFVRRRRKYAALGLEIILLVAEEHEKEIRDAVKVAVAKISEVDPKAAGKAVGDWVRSNPTTDRVKMAGLYVKRAAGDARLAVERTLVGAAARVAGANGKSKNGAAPKKRPKARAPKTRTSRKG